MNTKTVQLKYLRITYTSSNKEADNFVLSHFPKRKKTFPDSMKHVSGIHTKDIKTIMQVAIFL